MPIRHPVRIVLGGLALGLAFDRLVVDHALGVGFSLFVALVLAALGLALAWERLAPIRQNLWILAPVLFFAVMVAVRANEFVTFLNVFAVLLLLCVIAVFFLRRPLTTVNLPGYALAPLFAPVMVGLRGAQTSRMAAVATTSAWQAQPRRSWLPVLRGVLLASPVVLIFALLLTSADAMFAEVLHRILPVDFLTFVQDLLTHGLVVVVVGFLLLGGLAYTTWRDGHAKDASAAVLDMSISPVLGLTESAVVLNAVNVLFAAFVVIQIPYLFGGQLSIDLGNITYAEYARRGFGELIMASVLVLAMLLALGALTRQENSRQRLIFNLSSTITVGLTVVMLISAFKRLLLYEMAYGFTEMRVYPHVFMIWLALVLAWFLVTLWFKPGRFAIGLVVACIGFVATLDVLNVDDFVVRQNVERYVQLGSAAFAKADQHPRADDRIDPDYLTLLSDDAIPGLVQSVGRLEGAAQGTVQTYLLKRYTQFVQEEGDRAWQGLHLARSRARLAVVLWHDSPG
jgi:hypothetical protein